MSDLELSFSGWRFTLKYTESSLFGVVHPGRVSICFGGPCGVLVLGVTALFWYLSVLVLKAARMDSSSAEKAKSTHAFLPFSRGGDLPYLARYSALFRFPRNVEAEAGEVGSLLSLKRRRPHSPLSGYCTTESLPTWRYLIAALVLSQPGSVPVLRASRAQYFVFLVMASAIPFLEAGPVGIFMYAKGR